jgi:hypothetical protein
MKRENHSSQLAHLQQALAGHPTPNTPSGGANSQREGRGAGGADLEEVANLAGYPTCRVNGSTEDHEQLKARSVKNGTNLDAVADMAGHPSPRAEDSEQTGAHRGNPDTLNSCSKLAGHHTCAVRDARNSSGDGTNPRDNPRLQALARGQTTSSTDTSTAKTAGYRLNPGFSLWLMIGIPTIVDAWACCGVRAMQSCRRSRKSS